MRLRPVWPGVRWSLGYAKLRLTKTRALHFEPQLFAYLGIHITEGELSRLHVAPLADIGIGFLVYASRRVQARLDAGELGQVYCFNGTNQGELPKRHRAWFVDPKLAGGGAVLDHTVHLVDIMRWYLGSEVVEVYCQTNKIFHADEVEVETGGLLMLTFANGVFASIDCSWSKPDYYPTWGGLTFEMVTERGAVQVDAFKQNLTVYSRPLQRPVWAHWGSDSNQAMLEEFVAGIREDRPPKVTGLDGYRALEVALAAYLSAKSGFPYRLPSHVPISGAVARRVTDKGVPPRQALGPR